MNQTQIKLKTSWFLDKTEISAGSSTLQNIFGINCSIRDKETINFTEENWSSQGKSSEISS